MANCTFEPPVSTPISRRTAIEASRITWNSLSVSVSAGATVIESPVCTPIGSMFSIEQTMMQLSSLSRTTSISNSFQPATDSSISTSLVGEASSAGEHQVVELLDRVGDAAAGAAEREGGAHDRRQAGDPQSPRAPACASAVLVAPSVRTSIRCRRCRSTLAHAGRRRSPRREAACGHSSVHVDEGGLRRRQPDPLPSPRGRARGPPPCRSPAALAPIISTPNFSSTPILFSDSAQFSAVCPPMVGSSACRPGARCAPSR